MPTGCDLELDINGEEVFMVHKKILEAFSGIFRRLFSKINSSNTTNVKVIFEDFPGGAECFELILRFCYNRGKTEITPFNIFLLNSAAHFLEMDHYGSQSLNLLAHVEKSLENIYSWSWSELLLALKQYQDLHPSTNSSFIIRRVLYCLVSKLVFSSITSPNPCNFSENSSVKFSCDTTISDSLKSNCSRTTWWFEDLVFFSTNIIEKVIRVMLSQEFDQVKIFRFLFYYHKLKVIGASPAQKRKITEVVIGLFCLLDRSYLSFKGLFNVYQVALRVQTSKRYISKLEGLMGSKLDQATINYLLVPSHPLDQNKYVYDVNMVMRFVKAFLFEGGSNLQKRRLNKVSKLVDTYLNEVAPDSNLRPSKFSELASLLPDCSRKSHDTLYQAMDIYFQVHVDLDEEEKISVCRVLKYEKLSTEALKHLVGNTRFSIRTSVNAFNIARDSKVRSLVQKIYQLKCLSDPLFCKTAQDILVGKENGTHVLVN